MTERASDVLTARFYDWEKRGRGWVAFDDPVEPEPIFWPFFGHFIPEQPVIDDGRHETIFSVIGNLFRPKKETPPQGNVLFEIPPVEGAILNSEEELTVHSIVFPKGEKIRVEDMERLLLMLSYTHYPVSFEIIATNSAISLQLASRESDTAQLYGQ